jgi:RNA polymerase sigma-70 factor (ECF subfamily)
MTTKETYSFEQFIQDLEALRPLMLSKAKRLCTNNLVDPEDLVQDTMLKAVRQFKKGSYTHKGKLSSWIGIMQYNIFCQLFKKQKNLSLEGGPIILNQDNGINKSMDHKDTSLCPEICYSSEDYCKLILEVASENLNDQQKNVLDLYLTQGLSYIEISKVSGTPIGTTMSRIHRMRQKATESLRNHPEIDLSFLNDN